MKLLPRTEIRQRQQRNTHKSGKRKGEGTGLAGGWGRVKVVGVGGGETMPKRRANFESMTPLNAVFWFHYALPGSIYQRAGDGQQVAMPRPLAAAATLQPAVCHMPQPASTRHPPPASHTLLVACHLKQGIPKKEVKNKFSQATFWLSDCEPVLSMHRLERS